MKLLLSLKKDIFSSPLEGEGWGEGIHCRIIYILLIIAISATSMFSQNAMTPEERKALVKEHYQKAIIFYNIKEYADAIKYWEEILKIDPSQTQVNRLIEDAKVKLGKKYDKILQNMDKYYQEGKYDTAYEKIKEISHVGSAMTQYEQTLKRVEQVKGIFGKIDGNSKVSKLVKTSAYYYIKDDPGKTKTMLNSLIYAKQLDPKNDKVKEFYGVVEEAYPKNVKSIEIVPGMNLVEQKLQSALNCIYDGKYDKTIVECNEVIELEPDSVLALKRLGSAYYALGKIDLATEAWKKAVDLDPSDEELKRFIKKK